MPNNAQQELLESFIGREGFFYETIMEYESLDHGTKILYLQRAINQDCQTFLQALDKLYSPNLEENKKQGCFELIRSLKAINDLCFNNDVKLDVDLGVKPALDAYFGAIGEVEPHDFRTTVQEMINAGIADLRDEPEQNVAAEIAAREAAEGEFDGHPGWRAELDLPLAQQAGVEDQSQQERQVIVDVIQQLNGALTEEQYQQLAEESRQIITGNIANTRRLIQNLGATFEQIQALPAQEFRQFLDNYFKVSHLVEYIPFAEIFALDQAVRAELFRNYDKVTRLVCEWQVSFEQLSELSVEELRIVISNPDSDEAQEILNPPASNFRPG